MKKIVLLYAVLCVIFPISWVNAAQIYADRELANNYVAYLIPNASSDDVILYVKYPEKKSDSELKTAFFSPRNPPLTDGKHQFFLVSKENVRIDCVAVYNNGKMQYVKTTTEYSEQHLGNDNRSILTLGSEGGYEIVVECHWEDKRLALLKIYPRIHPYKDFK